MTKEMYMETRKKGITDEHHTPDEFLDFSRLAMSTSNFDLDPATASSNPTNAKQFFTEYSNGLDHNWYGKVFLNPPFSKNLDFARKVVEQVSNTKSMLVLAKGDFRTRWSNLYLSSCDYLIVYNGYVKFVGSNNAARFSVVMYGYGLDENNLKFACSSNNKFRYFKNNK